MKYLLYFLLLTIALSSCKTYSDDDKKKFDQQIKEYLTKKRIKCVKTDSGLYYKIIEPGKGEKIRFLDIVSFSYKGSLLTGEVFDNQKEPVEFAVKELFGAWKEIMLELKPGAKAYLVAPPHLGYGDRKLDDIPANSILVFELSIAKVK